MIKLIPTNLQQPLPSQQLINLRLLHNRKYITEDLSLNLKQLTRGYEGELEFFNQLLEQIHQSAIIINNLILHCDDSEIQIDSLLIVGNNIYLFEVKNYYGDYLIKDERWYNVKNQNEIRNPLIQLNRSRYLFQKILQQQNFNLNLHTYLIFINKEFTLYMPSPNNKIILPTQLNRFLTQLGKQSFQHEQHHIQLIKYLVSNHRHTSKYTTLPEYNFNQLRKGMICVNCDQFVVRYNKSKFKCSYCRKITGIDILLIKAIEEFKVLFPNKTVTVNLIYEWCDRLVSDNTIRKTLNNNYKKMYQGKSAYYVSNKSNE